MNEIIFSNFNDRYKNLGLIGQGGYGKVYLGKRYDSEKLYAIKKIDLKTNNENWEEINNEIRALKLLSLNQCHPNIVCYEGVFRDEGSIYLVTEYYQGIKFEDIFDYFVEKYKDLDLAYELIYSLLVDLIITLNYIHKNGIVHGDIKPENILIMEDRRDDKIRYRPVIIDFGLSCFIIDKQCQQPTGAPLFIAPELLLGKTYPNEKTDVWSLGASFYSILVDKDVWPEIWPIPPNKRAIERLIDILQLEPHDLVFDYDEEDSEHKQKTSIILNHMTKFNPNQRYNTGQLLEAIKLL